LVLQGMACPYPILPQRPGVAARATRRQGSISVGSHALPHDLPVVRCANEMPEGSPAHTRHHAGAERWMQGPGAREPSTLDFDRQGADSQLL
jgi:hypothetical protein